MAGKESPPTGNETPEASSNSENPKMPPCHNSKATLSYETTHEKSEIFDPHNFGKEDGIGLFGAAVHIIRTTIGSGILLMPYTMKNLGLLYGTVVLIFVGMLYYCNIHILISTEYHLCRLERLKCLSFVGVVRTSFHRAPSPINKLKSIMTQFARLYFCVPQSTPTYLIIIATNIQFMADFFDVKLNSKLTITALIIPFILITQKRNILKFLVPFSSVTNMFTVVMVSVIISSSFIYRVDSSPKIFGDEFFIPKGFAMFILAIRSTGLLLPLKNDMKNRKQFSQICGSLNIAGASITLIYYGFALICYINYGDTVHDNILFNLPSKSGVSFVVYLLYTLSLSISYLLSFTSCFNNLWANELELKIKDGWTKTICDCGIRLGMNVFSYLMAIAVPRISLIAAITGTFGILIDIALPPFLQLLLQISEKQVRCFTVLKNSIIITIAAGLFCMSATRCAHDLIKLYTE